MEEIIITGSAAAAASPGFLSQAGVEFFSQAGGDHGQPVSVGTEEEEEGDAT